MEQVDKQETIAQEQTSLNETPESIDETPESIVETQKSTIEEPRIKVVQWNPVGIWTPKIACDDFQCSICKKKTTSKCGDCSGSYNIATQDCQIAQGTCGHGYHYHCINKWLGSGSQICPICRIPWNYKSQNIEQVKNGFLKRVKKTNTSKIAQPKATKIAQPKATKIAQVD